MLPPLADRRRDPDPLGMLRMGNPGQYSVPAIVWGRGPTALGILRCLRIAGIPTSVACPPGDHVTHSRWYTPTPGPHPWDGALNARTADALRAIPLERAVVIPGADDGALWLADVPHSDLGARFRVSSSSRETLEILEDKTRFADFLRGTDIPHPRTFYIESEADIDAVPYDDLDSTFVKPANSQQFSDVTGVKAVRVSSKDELRRVWEKLHAQGFKLMAQEYVPGPPSNHYFVDGFRDRDGTLTGLFTRRRIRIHPPDFGNSSYCVSIPLTEIPEAIASMVDLLARVNYRGIFSAEFKKDARDGKFRILEVNTRAWTYVEFAGRCGVNVCEMAYQDALELPVTVAPTTYPIGAGCVDFHRDLSSVRTPSKHDRDPLPKILLQWMTAHYHSFRFDDPGPGLSAAKRIVTGYFRRRSRNA
jgi:D-aspartate ligase